MFRILGLLLVLWQLAAVVAWGPEGHKITAYIAMQMMDSSTYSNVQQYLGGKSLVDIAPLPDDYDHSKYVIHRFFPLRFLLFLGWLELLHALL